MSNALMLSNLDYDVSHMLPKPKRLLYDPDGYLSGEDLVNFDSAVNEFINGKFFLHKSSAAAVIDGFKKLRGQREKDFHFDVINSFLQLLHVAEEEVLATAAVFKTKIVKKWGEGGLPVDCFAVVMDTVYENSDMRDSLASQINARYKLGHGQCDFPYSRSQMEKAMQKYEDPLGGRVAALENVKFEQCECLGNDGKLLYPPHEKCTRKAVVIKRTVMSNEELLAKLDEDEDIDFLSAEIKSGADMWLKSADGRGSYSHCACFFLLTQSSYIGNKKIKAAVRQKRAIFEKALQFAKANLQTKKAELKAAKTKDAEIRQRKFCYDDGLAISFHRFESREECDRVVKESYEQVAAASREFDDATSAVDAAKKNVNRNQSQMFDVLRSQLFKEEIKVMSDGVRTGGGE
jgi:hypothetical protein